MDIEKLEKKRQMNVQEQNASLRHRILEEATHWRTNGIPFGLQPALESKGINTEESIYLNYEQDFPGVNSDEGIVLSSAGEFFEFEIALNKARTELVEFYHWEILR